LHKKVQAIWQQSTQQRYLFHLRIIICWAGFTATQHQAVSTFNGQNPTQPILLIEPTTETVGAAIYGSQVYDHLRNELPRPKNSQKRTSKLNTTDWLMRLPDNHVVPGEECEPIPQPTQSSSSSSSSSSKKARM